MTTWRDTDRGPVCDDCMTGCPRPAHWAACDREHCRCPCRDRDRGRARELDDRPPSALESIARDMAAEARPDVATLHTERYGPPALDEVPPPWAGTVDADWHAYRERYYRAPPHCSTRNGAA